MTTGRENYKNSSGSFVSISRWGDVAAIVHSLFIKQVHFCPFFMHFICINIAGCEGDAGGDTAGCGLEH